MKIYALIRTSIPSKHGNWTPPSTNARTTPIVHCLFVWQAHGELVDRAESIFTEEQVSWTSTARKQGTGAAATLSEVRDVEAVLLGSTASIESVEAMRSYKTVSDSKAV